MTQKIALVCPVEAGGVRTITLKLYRSLMLEGFKVKLLSLGKGLFSVFYKDARSVKKLENFDVVIYLGSIAWPSHLLISNPKKGVFIHGFVQHEYISSIRHNNVRTRLGAALTLSYWNFLNKNINKLNFFITHSITTYETVGIRKRPVILPQFVLQTEVEEYKQVLKYYENDSSKNAVRIVTYSSLAESPRLLKMEHIAFIAKMLSKLVKHKLEFIVVEPQSPANRPNFNFLKTVRYMPREEFLKLLVSSDLYIERCIDEELRYGSLESGLLGVPVAKITHPAYVTRQDYSDNDLILAKSVREFISRLAEYIDNLDHFKPYYSKHIKDFVINKRSWNHVKEPLIKELVTD